jgi:hypothetical protein
MQGEEGRRRRSLFAESTNRGSENTLFVPPLVLLSTLWIQQLVPLDAKLNAVPKVVASVASSIVFLNVRFVPVVTNASALAPDVLR